MTLRNRRLTEDGELTGSSDVLVFVIHYAAVRARVVIRDAADQQVAAAEQRVLPRAEKKEKGKQGLG